MKRLLILLLSLSAMQASAALKSTVYVGDPILAEVTTGVKKLKLGTATSKITRNNSPAEFTYTSVKVFDKNPILNYDASVLVELQNVGVIVGIATGTEANVVVGTGSLNALPDGNYWVLSSRPSGASYAISLGYRQIVTE